MKSKTRVIGNEKFGKIPTDFKRLNPEDRFEPVIIKSEKKK